MPEKMKMEREPKGTLSNLAEALGLAKDKNTSIDRALLDYFCSSHPEIKIDFLKLPDHELPLIKEGEKIEVPDGVYDTGWNPPETYIIVVVNGVVQFSGGVRDEEGLFVHSRKICRAPHEFGVSNGLKNILSSNEIVEGDEPMTEIHNRTTHKLEESEIDLK